MAQIKVQDISTKIMVLALILMAFVIGMLFQKVQNLQGGNQITNPNQVVATSPTPQPISINDAGGVGHFPVRGDKNAKVTLIEFADFRCPYCEQFFTQTESQIIRDYVNTGKVKLAFRQYPFLGPASIVAADAAECANDQNKFWEYHDYLYKNQPSESDTSMYNTDTLTKAAVGLGMDGSKFRTCLDTKADEGKALQDLSDGQKAGVTGTPVVFLNGAIVPGGAQPYAVFKAAIDNALK